MEPNMKLSVLSASLIAFSLMTGASFAATTAPAKAPAATTAPAETHAVTSMIKLIDLKTHQLTLDDGKTFVLPKSWTLHGYKTGEKVKVIYHEQMGTMTVTKISKA
jgi:Cu/Ag efflux protein CusF